MAEFFDALTDKHLAFIKEQPMFCTATACATGRVNVSPKGMDCFRVISPGLVGYLDLSGSGNETAAHIHNDGRLTIMFNSFTRTALILRLYGRGEVVARGTEKAATLEPHFPTDLPGYRQLILLHVDSVQTSCGYAVPEMDLKAERQTLVKFAQNKGESAMKDYRASKGGKSIDGFDSGFIEGA